MKVRAERFDMEVGVLDDKPHRDPIETPRGKEPVLGSYAGGPVRKATRKTSGVMTGAIFIENQKRLGIDLLKRPFQDESSDLMKFTRAFLQYAVSQKPIPVRRIENLLQAVVRNPILKLQYGKNKATTADAKGFDRHMFDTGQMFKAIRAKVSRV